MPAQQRLWRDEKARPEVSGQDRTDRGEQRAVGGLEPRAWNLAAEHGELVAEDKDLEVLGGVTAGQEGERLDGAAQGQVGKSG
jgi:hypothetical protein